jgi:hypothetical protein
MGKAGGDDDGQPLTLGHKAGLLARYESAIPKVRSAKLSSSMKFGRGSHSVTLPLTHPF